MPKVSDEITGCSLLICCQIVSELMYLSRTPQAQLSSVNNGCFSEVIDAVVGSLSDKIMQEPLALMEKTNCLR